jgi:molybdate transport system ATP-binding protein
VRDAGPVSHVLGRLDFARWWGDESGVVIDGTVDHHDDEYQLTLVTTPLGAFTIQRREDPPGTPVRLQVNGRDVSIGLAAQEASSILNELPVAILEIADLTPSHCLVRLGRRGESETVLLARITRKSRDQLGLETGSDVFARVKSVAVLD